MSSQYGYFVKDECTEGAKISNQAMPDTIQFGEGQYGSFLNLKFNNTEETIWLEYDENGIGNTGFPKKGRIDIKGNAEQRSAYLYEFYCTSSLASTGRVSFKIMSINFGASDYCLYTSKK